ncbi:MFS transporter [Gordonia jinhuaensis]|nr:MFS transporter [Gordonia jinhuaensis]
MLGRLGSGTWPRTTILGCMVIVVIGGVLTTLPLEFGFLLAGRVLQGIGLGCVPLLMSVARTHMSSRGSASTIAGLSVASTVGIGVGYPLIGLIEQVSGLRAAYGLGLALSVAALAVAWLVIPREKPGPVPRIDWWGAALLALGTTGVLILIADQSVWRTPLGWLPLLVASVVVLAGWVTVELHVPAPLVNLRVLSQPTVLGANVAMLVAGVGMYLLFTLFTRYLQTPSSADYGFALPGIASGAALIPFSALGFVAGRTTPMLIRRTGVRWAYLLSAVAVMCAAVIFALTLDSMAAVMIAMAVLGFGVGGISAVMPRLVLTRVPDEETASVLTVNAIVRSIGFSIGSAVGGLLLTVATSDGELIPARGGYVTAALWALPPLALSVAIVCARPVTRRGRART